MAIPYEINDWNSTDFAIYYQREEDKKYELSLEEYKKKCQELERRMILKDEAMNREFEKRLKKEISKALIEKEDELLRKFNELIETNDLENLNELMQKEINRRVEQAKQQLQQLAEQQVEQKLEIKYKDLLRMYKKKIENQQIQIDTLNRKTILKKPKKMGDVFVSKYNSQCSFCKAPINAGDSICNAKFDIGLERFVHQDCCEWDGV